jgi:hypothetical protein
LCILSTISSPTGTCRRAFRKSSYLSSYSVIHQRTFSWIFGRKFLSATCTRSWSYEKLKLCKFRIWFQSKNMNRCYDFKNIFAEKIGVLCSK